MIEARKLIKKKRPPHGSASNNAALRDNILLTIFTLDCIISFGSGMVAFFVRFKFGLIPAFGMDLPDLNVQDYLPIIIIGTLSMQLILSVAGAYNWKILMRFESASPRIFKASMTWVIYFLSLSLFLKIEPSISRLFVLSWWVFSLVLLLLNRKKLANILLASKIADKLREKVLFLGWNDSSNQLMKTFSHDPRHLYHAVGFVNTVNEEIVTPLPLKGSVIELEKILKEDQVDICILSDLERPTLTVDIVNTCEREYVSVRFLPNFAAYFRANLHLEMVNGIPLCAQADLPLDKPINRFLKRIVDVIGSLIGLVLATPLMCIFGVLVHVESPGPIFYSQIRTGKNGRSFRIYKIRSMRLDAEITGAKWSSQNDDRRLRIGGFMRRWNIDEVPQFWNVLKGEMSLVGPRPERPEFIEQFKYTVPHYNARHRSKPGLTGFAQVNGLRGNTSLEARIRYDCEYLERWSLWFDFEIICLTFIVRDNAY